MRRKRVLLISHSLMHYRVPLFNLLNEDVDLTVATGTDYKGSENTFKVIKITLSTSLGFIRYSNLPELSNYDVVIYPFGLRVISLYYAIYSRKRSFKVFVFGIGVSASYNRPYDSSWFYDIWGKYILNKIDGAIFYDRYPEVKYVARNHKIADKISIAYNTVMPNRLFDKKIKTFESFLFIGTLYKAKKIYELIETYKLYTGYTNNPKKLEIVGKGPESLGIMNLIKYLGMEDFVVLHGELTSDLDLLPIFGRAIACISPGQAGLSVQKCFSYGVPFICAKTAITGGEINSIIDGVTGFLYNEGGKEELLHYMLFLSENDEEAIKLSDNAYDFYTRYRNTALWKKGFLKNILKEP